MRTVGIIGGLGPETSAEFYLEVVFGCYQKNKEARPPVLIWNVPLKYEIERELLISAKGEELYVPFLKDAARRLEKGGADFIVMPCNSMHIFIREIRAAVKTPVLSIVEETIKFLCDRKIRKVGLLATTSSLKHDLYGTALKKAGITQVLPDDFDQARIGKIISNIILDRRDNKDRQELIRIIDKFVGRGVKNVILACTDLQLLIPHHDKLVIYDTMKIFSDATVDEILK